MNYFDKGIDKYACWEKSLHLSTPETSKFWGFCFNPRFLLLLKPDILYSDPTRWILTERVYKSRNSKSAMKILVFLIVELHDEPWLFEHDRGSSYFKNNGRTKITKPCQGWYQNIPRYFSQSDPLSITSMVSIVWIDRITWNAGVDEQRTNLNLHVKANWIKTVA